mmetsp:Transcript_105617/g.308858  ORF Transcript_105617/g.308858 Transcript_105617/m.308858 type:complete len:225 (-) Transcript_105617:291-965(-)
MLPCTLATPRVIHLGDLDACRAVTAVATKGQGERAGPVLVGRSFERSWGFGELYACQQSGDWNGIASRQCRFAIAGIPRSKLRGQLPQLCDACEVGAPAAESHSSAQAAFRPVAVEGKLERGAGRPAPAAASTPAVRAVRRVGRHLQQLEGSRRNQEHLWTKTLCDTRGRVTEHKRVQNRNQVAQGWPWWRGRCRRALCCGAAQWSQLLQPAFKLPQQPLNQKD